MSSSQTIFSGKESSDLIRSRSCPSCYLCGSRGEVLHENLEDRLFGAPGTWNLKRCPDRACGLVWLDPMPLEEDIGKAYKNYYTHANCPANRNDSKGKEFVRSLLVHAHDLLLRTILVDRERRRLDVMYLEQNTPGKLLDVGCGDGSRLARMRALGWEVMGQEVDFAAAFHARSAYGLPVRVGSLEEAKFPDASFDAIIMNHVIEHAHDPVGLLTECRRVLKVGGTCVAVTPNVEGYGYRRSGPCWRGLEPPRHIHLFSQKTLVQVARKAHFDTINTWTTVANAGSFMCGTLRIRLGEQTHETFLSRMMGGISITAYEVWIALVHLANEDSGEECVLLAAK